MRELKARILRLFDVGKPTGEQTYFFVGRSGGYTTDKVVLALKELETEGKIYYDNKKWYLKRNTQNSTPKNNILSAKNSFKESLIDILEDAVEQQKSGIDVLMRYSAAQHDVTRSKSNRRILSDEINKRVYWLTYNTVGTTPFNEDGRYVPRNSMLGKLLQETHPGYEFRYQIKGTGIAAAQEESHDGHIHNTMDFANNVINIEGADKDVSFNYNLEKRLEQLRHQAKHGGELPQLSGKEYLLSFINKSAQKRDAGGMTPEQVKAKFYNIFNGVSVIVEGGPGTGKTTSMISRIGLLADVVQINENFKGKNDYFDTLTRAQKNHLLQRIKEDRDWIFFTPSNLICQYMASSMNKEGLSKPFAKVYNWETYRKEWMKELGFFDEKSPHPKFRDLGDADSILMKDEWAIIQEFTQFYIQSLTKVEHTSTSVIYDDLKKVIDVLIDELASIENRTIAKVIHKFMDIHSEMGDSLSRIITSLSMLVGNMTESVYSNIIDDEDTKQYILDATKRRKKKPDEDEEGDEAQEDVPNSEEQQIRGFIRQLIEPYALFICYGKKLSPSKAEAVERLAQYLLEADETLLKHIAKYSQFKPFARLGQGVKVNILKDISKIYKDFRKQQLKEKSKNWDLELLNTIIDDSKNKDLHYQEQSLLIGFINNLCKQVRAITKEADDHKYVAYYLENVRPIIGIDEATDFSLVEIYAMASFALPEFSSITLDGDLMQRLTTKGIRQWSDLEHILPNYKIQPLTLSFRQSVKMLNLARQLYKDSVGHDPDYIAKKSANTVPDPLAFVHADEYEKLNWIEKRIQEIYDIYGTLPSTAIFLNDHEKEFKFSQDLGARPFFQKTGIKVVVGNEGENLAKENLVRVFSIDKVKGMEFDAVFFHNIDQTPYSGDLIKRFIYVGVSRAAFFLGITMSKKNQANDELLKYFDTKANWKYFE